MKKTISLILALVMAVSIATPSFAAETGEKYYTVQVKYSDNIRHQEQLDLMIQNGHVYADAKMLAERLGYTFGENGESAVIFNRDRLNGLPVGITQFQYNSTQVSHMLFNNMIDTYEAPFASVKNEKGSWIPLEYSLLLLNSGMMITDRTLHIDIPSKRIIDYFYDIARNSEKYNFDWADDFGYTETNVKILGGSSHLVNVFNGLLKFDGASWATLFQQFTGSTASYDKKYGENLAMLLCTESDKELRATMEKVKLLSGLLNVDGDLGKLLSVTSDMSDFQVGTLYKQCEAVLDGIKTGNSSAVAYSRSYQALEDALNRQTWFSHTGGNILEIQKGVSSAAGETFKLLDIGTKVAEFVGYAREFQNQDEFSLAAFRHYLETAHCGNGLPDAMRVSMIDYSDALSSSVGGYMKKQFLKNIDQWLLDAAKEKVPLHRVFGRQATAALLAWDIASNTIPFISNGLSGADSFELTLYSTVFQGDAFLNYLSKRDSVFADAGNITAENIYEISQYCYIYLKSCYITREAALASLVNKTSSTKEKIQPLIDYQNNINDEIAKIMVALKGANATNKCHVFGFLPSDNEEYLSEYDDNQLIQWTNQFNVAVSSNEWKEAYINYVNEHITTHGRNENIYKLVNINNDSVPELYINFMSTAGGDGIYTYYEGKVIEQPMWNFGFSYIEGQNIFVDSGGHMDVYYDKIYTIENGKFVLLYEGDFGASDNSNVEFDSDGYPIYNYYWNGTTVSSEDEYINLLNEVYNAQQAITPFDGAVYNSETGRYEGNGLCDYGEIIETINAY